MDAPPAFTPSSLAFRLLRLEDIPRIHGWFNEPHAKRWFGDSRPEADTIAKYTACIKGGGSVHPFICTYAEHPIGLVEWIRLGDYPDYMRTLGVVDPEVVNCDVIIGDPAFAHRGLGGSMTRRFLAEVVFVDPRVSACILDPEAENRIAIRCYEKAGFRHIRTVHDEEEGETLYLMELRRDE